MPECVAQPRPSGFVEPGTTCQGCGQTCHCYNSPMTMAAAGTPEPLIRWGYCWSALAGLGIMIAAIVIGNLWFLNFVHVFSSLLWTGIDLFMGFVLGPILRRMDIFIRREVARRLTPRTLFLMPTISIISGTTGCFLSNEPANT